MVRVVSRLILTQFDGIARLEAALRPGPGRQVSGLNPPRGYKSKRLNLTRTPTVDANRRNALRLTLGLTLAGALPARAAEHRPRLSESDAQAQQLNYRHDADSVDPQRFPQRKQQNQSCGNCQFFSGEKDGWGDCTLFPDKLVKETGWCSGWAPNMG